MWLTRRRINDVATCVARTSLDVVGAAGDLFREDLESGERR